MDENSLAGDEYWAKIYGHAIAGDFNLKFSSFDELTQTFFSIGS